MIALQILVAWLLADFLSGVVHWLEDRYLGERSLDFAQGIAADNQLHHERPTAMLLNSYWGNMRSGAYVAWPLGAMLWFAHAPLWLWAGVTLCAFGNLVHRFAHTPRVQLPRWIRGLQEFGLFISHAHHDTHHREEGRLIPKTRASRAYCAMTDWVNPLLDRLRFGDRCETVLAWLGIRTIA